MANRGRDAPARMDVFEAARTLLAVRAYQDRAVPETVVRRIVETGFGGRESVKAVLEFE